MVVISRLSDTVLSSELFHFSLNKTMNWSNLHRQPYVHLVWMMIVISGITFYIFVLFKIYKNRTRQPFNSTFFRIWMHVAVTDLFTAVQVIFLQSNLYHSSIWAYFSELDSHKISIRWTIIPSASTWVYDWALQSRNAHITVSRYWEIHKKNKISI